MGLGAALQQSKERQVGRSSASERRTEAGSRAAAAAHSGRPRRPLLLGFSARRQAKNSAFRCSYS
jgi:hypothetical protein